MVHELLECNGKEAKRGRVKSKIEGLDEVGPRVSKGLRSTRCKQENDVKIHEKLVGINGALIRKIRKEIRTKQKQNLSYLHRLRRSTQKIVK